ncbi:MAG: DUF2306 domain-containing protein [Maricaulaceae bacterium]
MNWYVLENMSLAIKIHLAVAVLAFAFGIMMWVRPKGTRSHKILGRSFVGLMIITAISAIFIREINNGSFSWIHLFVPLTLVGSWQVVNSARQGQITKHRKHVKGLFFGALLIPGFFAFMPGRHLWAFFFSAVGG